MTHAWISLYVDCLEETIRFYRDAFGCEPVGSSNEDGTVKLRFGGCLLHFTEVMAVERLRLLDVEAPLVDLPQGCELVLTIEPKHCKAVRARALDAGALLVREEATIAGDRATFMRDPNGFLIRLQTASV